MKIAVVWWELTKVEVAEIISAFAFLTHNSTTQSEIIGMYDLFQPVFVSHFWYRFTWQYWYLCQKLIKSVVVCDK